MGTEINTSCCSSGIAQVVDKWTTADCYTSGAMSYECCNATGCQPSRQKQETCERTPRTDILTFSPTDTPTTSPSHTAFSLSSACEGSNGASGYLDRVASIAAYHPGSKHVIAGFDHSTCSKSQAFVGWHHLNNTNATIYRLDIGGLDGPAYDELVCFNAQTGKVVITPQQLGAHDVQLSAQDSAGGVLVIANWKINVSPDISKAISRNTSDDTSDTIIYGLMTAVILLFSFVAVLVVRSRRQKRIDKTPVDFSDRVDQMLASGLIQQRGSMLTAARTPVELRRSRIELLEILGTGAFGEVRKGIYNPDSPDTPEYTVAVKVLKGEPSSDEKDDLLQEAVVTSQFKHPHVIALVGCVTSGMPYMLVLQFCEGGALVSILRASRSQPASIEDSVLLGYCIGIAAGMEYLSGKKFVHRDLATRNVLVDSRKQPKVSDMGLSRDLEDNNCKHRPTGFLPLAGMIPPTHPHPQRYVKKIAPDTRTRCRQ